MDSGEMFRKFTDRARKVMEFARVDAQRFGHEYMGTEHILLGLVQERSGIASRVLRNLGVKLQSVRSQVRELCTDSPWPVESQLLPFTPRAKRALESARREAVDLGHDYIGTEHILLGLLGEGEGVAAQVLKDLGIQLGDVRSQVLAVLEVDAPAFEDALPTRPRGAVTIQQVKTILAGDIGCPILGVPVIADHLGPGVAATLRAAARAAEDGGRRPAGLEHLLLGLTGWYLVEVPSFLSVHGLARATIVSSLRALEEGDAGRLRTSWSSLYSVEITKTICRAWSIALRSGAARLEEIHLLVALLRSEPGRWSEVVDRCGAKVEELRSDAEEALLQRRNPPGPPPSGAARKPRLLAEGAWRGLREAWGHARRLRHTRVGLPHLLAAFLEGHARRAEVCAHLETIPPPEAADDLRLNSAGANALERAYRMAMGLDRDDVPAEAVLLGAIEEDQQAFEHVLVSSLEELNAWTRPLWVGVSRPALPWEGQVAQAKVLSAEALEALRLACASAGGPRAGALEPKHLTRALVEASDGSAARLVQRLGIDPGIVQAGAAEPDAHDVDADEVLLSPPTIQVVAMAAEEAFALRAAEIGGDHLLLALMRMGEALALRALVSVGLTLPSARIAALESALACDESRG